MKYIHVRNLEKYHPGYKDRSLQWAKIHFKMVQGDPDCEMITNEIDWGRLIKFILLELEAQKPIPLDDGYLARKGFNLKKRPISLTLNMLQNFVEVLQSESEMCVLDKSRVEEDKEKDKEEDSVVVKKLSLDEFKKNAFDKFWEKYPRKIGKPKARVSFMRIKMDEGIFLKIMVSLDTWIKSDQWNKDGGQFIPHPTTWLNQERWNDSPKVYTKRDEAIIKSTTDKKREREEFDRMMRDAEKRTGELSLVADAFKIPEEKKLDKSADPEYQRAKKEFEKEIGK